MSAAVVGSLVPVGGGLLEWWGCWRVRDGRYRRYSGRVSGEGMTGWGRLSNIVLVGGRLQYQAQPSVPTNHMPSVRRGEVRRRCGGGPTE